MAEMKIRKPRRPIGQRVHEWLAEPEGETFKLGKWRFWFIAVAGLQLLNALLTALIFQSTGNLQNYMGAILFGVGALVGWIAIGALHYSDGPDRKLARGVSLLDSVTLLFVILHFAFLMWAYGRLSTIQSAEAKYEISAATFNAKQERVSGDNVAIAHSAERIAEQNAKRAKIENDTAYQQRKAVEITGAPLPRSGSAAPAIGTGLATSQVELERPVKPEKSSAKFLGDWDAWIRAANFGELLLCALTLIFIRNSSAARNIPRAVYQSPAPEMVYRSPLGAANRMPAQAANLTTKKGPAKDHGPSKLPNLEGLKVLRETLSEISFHVPGFSFKAKVKGDAVWILMVKANKGTQETVSSAKARLSILDDAMSMPREAFRERVERLLNQNGFELEEKGGA
jgi:hypothetical protein